MLAISSPPNSGRALSPSSTGATYSSNSSTMPACNRAPPSVAPASTCTSLMPRRPSSCSAAARSSLPSPARGKAASSAPEKPFGARAPIACRYRVGALPSRTRPRATVARPGSSTTRKGGDTSVPSGKRTVSCGSSASTVPLAVNRAPLRARQCCTSMREASEVIHFDSPLASAVRPSRLMPSLIRSQGRPRSIREKKPRLSSRASASISPDSTAMPASRNFASPAPFTASKGSRVAATTRVTPAATNASAQGGVRPWCAQGSSVT